MTPNMMRLTAAIQDIMPPDKLSEARNRDYADYRRSVVWGYIGILIMAAAALAHQLHIEFKPIEWLAVILGWTQAIAGALAAFLLLGASVLTPLIVSRRYARGTDDRRTILADLRATMLRYRIHFAQIAVNLTWAVLIHLSGHPHLAITALVCTMFLHGSLMFGCYVLPVFIKDV